MSVVTIAPEEQPPSAFLVMSYAENVSIVAGPDSALRAEGDAEKPALYLHVRRGCEARLNRSTYEQLAQIALAEGDDWTVTSGGETFSLLPA